MPEIVSIMAGDCRFIVPTLGRFDFVFADPPADLAGGNLATFTAEWLCPCWEACGGVLAVHCDDDTAEQCLIESREIRMRRVAWITWAYKPGSRGGESWPDARRHCLIFARPVDHTWNPGAVEIVTDLGRRRLPGTVWGSPIDGKFWGPVTANNYERWRKSRGQLPELYLERLIKAYTSPGDRVLDPFGGSGTTAVVSAALGRECVTIEIDETRAESIRERLRMGSARV